MYMQQTAAFGDGEISPNFWNISAVHSRCCDANYTGDKIRMMDPTYGGVHSNARGVIENLNFRGRQLRRIFFSICEDRPNGCSTVVEENSWVSNRDLRALSCLR